MSDALHDLRTMVWKEWAEFVRQRSTIISMALFLVIFGVFLPAQRGKPWVDSAAPFFNSVLFPIMLVLGIVADSFAGERERHTLETLLASRLSDRAILFGKYIAILVYAWGITIASLLLGAVVVNMWDSGGPLVFYPARVASAALLFSLFGGGFAAAAGVLMSLHSSTVRQAAQMLSIGMTAIFVAIFAVLAVLPDAVVNPVIKRLRDLGPSGLIIAITLTLAAVDALLLTIAALRFRRTRLVLD